MEYKVVLVHVYNIRDFIKKWHYSKSIVGVSSDYCFALYDNKDLIGAMILGKLGMANCYKKYADNEKDVIELRRLCCIDDTPKNTESYFIGKVMRWLELNTDIKTVISYADPEYGHSGTIYKASNFQYMGTTSKGKIIIWGDKKYHDKTIRTTYNGKLKPFAQKVKIAIDTGEAYYKITQGKSIYRYDLHRKKQQKHGHLYEGDIGEQYTMF